ncbi:MAG: LysM peptidoglycan-binding domain-containing protein [Coriobacteriia bacterium]
MSDPGDMVRVETTDRMQEEIDMHKKPHRHAAHVRARDGMTPIEALLLVLLLCALVFTTLNGDYSGSMPSSLDTTTIRVRQADTLWGVAASHPVDGLDTAQTVALIQELNEMSDSALAAGQTLEVPAREGADTAMASRY